MAKKTPVEKADYINSRYKDYLRSSFYFGNTNLQNEFEKELDNTELFKGPYIDLSLPFTRGKTIRQLVEEGIVAKSFLELGNIAPDRPLYAHQERSIRQIASGRSAIVTTGTGSGKTESFLFPILNEILHQIENGDDAPGVRAVFLYPMNALVNDQIDRVREILKHYPSITYGSFTGDTPERDTEPKAREKRAEYRELNDGEELPINELISREKMREAPPHLLFTNYSMLEYMLIRPKDDSIFKRSMLKNWRFIVLDEAHSYSGATGIELSLLLRRICALADKKPNFILTSATLGEQGKSEQDIVNFATNLTSGYFEEKDIIFSNRIALNAANYINRVEGYDYTQLLLATKNSDLQSISEVVKKYGVVPSGTINEQLYDLLSTDKNVLHLYSQLKKETKPFSVILKGFSGRVSEKELVNLIELINKAEKMESGFSI